MKLKLPGAFDAACTGKRGAKGVVAPVSAVDCGASGALYRVMMYFRREIRKLT